MDEAQLVERLRAGDETAFAALVDVHHAALLRLAATFVPSRAVAEEVVQETWLAVVRGIDSFEGRSSLKTWIFHILVNRARSIGARERRASVPRRSSEPAVDPARFGSHGHWIDPPSRWDEDAVARLDAAATIDVLRTEIERLPYGQRQVVLLRDVEGLPSSEVCGLLGLSEANQRVLLHRGRSRLRAALAHHVGEGAPA